MATVILSHCEWCLTGTESTDLGHCLECGRPKPGPAQTYPTSPNSPGEDRRLPPSPRWGKTRGDA